MTAPGFADAQSLPGSGRILIAFSGGPDSVCLAANLVAVAQPRPVLAIHIDHGLDSLSQQRALRARELAAQLDLPLQLERVDTPPADGGEAAARQARYAILEAHLQDDELLVTGHHADDQAETILLRLLRGAGPQGLLGIPEQRRFGRGWIARPLLHWPRSAIVAWLQRHNLAWQDDPTNTDLGMDRNFLRHRIFPLLESRWPGLRQSLARSARLSSGASEALEELALQDLDSARRAVDRLDHASLQALSRYRQGQVLRYWCMERQIEPPPGRRIDDFLNQLSQARSDRQPSLEWQGQQLKLWRKQLWLHPVHPHPGKWQQGWSGQDKLLLPDSLGSLRLQGASAALSSPVTVRFERAGERIRLPNRQGSQSVRQLMAESGVPPWQRALWPRLERRGSLLAVGSRWLDRDFSAELKAQSLQIQWLQRPPEFLIGEEKTFF